MEYTSVPPGLTYRADVSSIWYCISGRPSKSEGDLNLISGLRRITPSPEHGTSQSTLSACGSSALNFDASFCIAVIILIPSRDAPSSMRPTRMSWRSMLYSFPLLPISSARVKLFPPGAAQTSSTVSLTTGRRVRQQSCDEIS